MKRFNLGHIELISDPSLHAPAQSAAARAQTQLIDQAVSLEEVQKSAGFEVLQPRWLPNAQLKLVRVYEQILTTSSSRKFLGTILKYSNGGTQWFVVAQRRFEDTPRIEIPFEAWERKISGSLAVFYTHSVPAAAHPVGRINIVQVIWERGDFLLELQGHGLSLDEMVRVGESLI